MWKKTLRSLDVRRRRREESLVAHGQCPDCTEQVSDPANNRCRASAARRLGDHARRLRNVAGENGQPLTVLSLLAERRAPAQIISFPQPSRR